MVKVNEQNDKKLEKFDCLSKICVDENGFVEYNIDTGWITAVDNSVESLCTLEEINKRKTKL